ncbi:hypothetical protein [Gluconobacter oxydans]|uniref:Glycosyltransferase RgtA/B/C/D-like domain-containing protein n=1 Tax=Gluconobacter oxydans TaxID=442 RepID=A0A149S981_GLUOY|nr:hypothetical protein [Gluconobacter oxydans]KXV23297.1 hypothetical protein AD934_00325 [Gluconobacter oxydans]
MVFKEKIAAISCLTVIFILGFFVFGSVGSIGGTDYIGGGRDPQAFIWFLNWFVFAFQNKLPLFWTNYVAAPVGMGLSWRTSIPALSFLAAPLTIWQGPTTSYNYLMRVAPGLFGMAIFLVVRSFTNRNWPACAAALLTMFSSYEMGQSLGHLNLSFVVCVPLSVWIIMSSIRAGWSSRRLALCFGPVFAFQFGVSQEIAATLLMSLGICSAWLWWREPSYRRLMLRLLPGLLGGLGLAALIVGPLLWDMLFGGTRTATSIANPSDYSTDLLNFVIPTDISMLHTHWSSAIAAHFRGNASEEAGYIGIPMIALLAWIRFGARTRPSSLLIDLGAIMAVLSLGPRLHVAGYATLPAPWGLVSWAPIFHDMLPARFMLYAASLWALAIAFWLSIRRSVKDACIGGSGICLSLLCLAPSLAMFAQRAHLDVAPGLRAIPQDSAVLVLPFVGDHIGAQVAAGMRFRLVAQGYLGGGVVPPFSRWPLMEALYNDRFREIDPQELSTFTAIYGAERIVVEYGVPHPEDAEALVSAAGWHFERQVGQDKIYEPPTKNPNSAALAVMRDAYFAKGTDAKRLARERMNVCAIRKFERKIGFRLAPVWTVYSLAVHLPVDPTTVSCKDRTGSLH